ncbi:hypothetical protein [uncultured Massilia sp.]|uniref:hypothetical protein n=1 Tax=uncultured Massilia sp. TaxID=169973 RepID=UPI0025EE5F20|nr:hypothetical protein [uncultured Massilia sp.]
MNTAWIERWRAARRLRTSRHARQLAALPPGLEAYWRRSAPQEYQGIPTDAFFFVRAAEGLMDFFDAVRRSGRACALPSDAADSVWHAWLRHDPAGLARFCQAHFGRPVPHIEREGLGSGALLHTLSACRSLDGARRSRQHLPALFRLDAALRMPLGHGYRLHGGEIAYARLDRQGYRTGWPAPHPGLTLQALYLAGAIDRTLLESHQRRAHRTDGGDGGASSGCGSFAAADGGSCSDGGGGSCGCSCGGGCGGGGD